ncbi:hypothetical protein CK556_03385 [Mesoplasma chauliocola]|uniref:ABC transporter n=1 Tax=Mesoplasma chauliocola TaxID=216427 RepID=A0A249SPH0_9MOLU|nr:hypothetical protein [Mesoplasma chauliocola]ASZ09371.1 hypothetical protein CK556_03385 [Mesoplasma chauliocola]
MISIIKGFRDEFTSRVMSSIKRISKFIGIGLIPILYGVTCLLAFWNPTANLGKAPVAILNEDNTVWVYRNNDIENFDFKIGVLTDQNFKSIDSSISKENAIEMSYDRANKFLYTNTGKIAINSDSDITSHIFQFNTWEIIKSVLNPKTDSNIKDEDYVFSSPELKQDIAFTNIRYVSSQNEISKQWKGKKYFVQAKIEKGFGEYLIQQFGSIFNNGSAPQANKANLDIWTTFERNFIFGYYLNSMIEMKSALIVSAIENFLGENIPSLMTMMVTKQFYQHITYIPEEEQIVEKSLGFDSQVESSIEIQKGKQYVISDAKNIKNLEDSAIKAISSENTVFGDITEEVSFSKDASKNTNGIFTNLISNLISSPKIIELAKILKFDLSTSKIPGVLQILNDNSHILNKYLFDIMHGINPLTDTQKMWINIDHLSLLKLDTKTEAAIKVMVAGINNFKPFNFQTYLPKINAIMKEKLGFNLSIIKPYEVFASSINKLNRNAVELAEFHSNMDEFAKANGFTNQTMFLNDLSSNIFKLIKSKLFDKYEIVNIEIAGLQNGIYGIGIGEFFIVIGLFVGTFMQTFIYDRARRTKKLKTGKWYVSKTMLMIVTGIVQVTALTIALSCTGWIAIGSAAMFSVWLWLLFVDLIFVLTIQGFWFLIKDETVSKLLIIIYLVVNISSGWGTFPSFMQFEFFHKLSFVAEFTYILHGLGSIVYGVGENGFNSADTLYIIQQAGILLIFALFFVLIGLFGAKHRNREIRFGSFNGKHVIDGMTVLGMQNEIDEFKSNRKIFKYNWNKMDDDIYLELSNKVRELHPYEGQFEWYKKRQKDGVFAPNETDRDIIKRNDDVEV